MKKFLATLLTFVMLFSLTMPAMAAEVTQTIYFENTGNWTTVNAYAWSALNDAYLVFWPGTTLTHVEDNIWSIEVPTNADNIIFNDGSSTQTADLTIPTDGKNLYNYGTCAWSTYGSTGDEPTINGNTEGDVTASYTPSVEIVAEAKWGTSANSLTESGTFAEALAATTAADSTVAYIQLLTNVTTEVSNYITSGVFTLDLNGKTLSSNGFTLFVENEGTVVTLTDSASGGMVTTSGNNYVAVSASNFGKVVINSGSYSGSKSVIIQENGICEINGGTFTASSSYAILANGNATLTITGGTFSGPMAAVTTSGTTNITGGTFNAGGHGHISYWNGKLNLSGYNANGLTLSQWTNADLTVSGENIVLPDGCTFKDDSGNAVTTLTPQTIYTIGTATPVEPTYTVTVNDAENGSVSADKTAELTKGKTVTLTVTPAEGYELDTLTVMQGETEITVTDNTFVMPEGDVTVTATFKVLKTEITGVSITIDSKTYDSTNTSAENPAVITPDTQSLILKVTGKNLQYNESAIASYVPVRNADTVLANNGWTISEDGTSATKDASWLLETLSSTRPAWELQYANDGNTLQSSGVYVTYQVPTYAVNISMAVANGTVTADPDLAQEGKTVTVTVEAEAGYAYVVNSLKVTNDTTGEKVTVDEATKSFVMPASTVTVTAEFEKLTVTSANTVWGSMAFTYTDGENGAEGAWTADATEGAGTVTVKNTGTTAITASAVYTAAEGYTEITGSLGDAKTLAATESGTFTLTLTGKPNKAITAGTKIGSVTVTITEASTSPDDSSGDTGNTGVF